MLKNKQQKENNQKSIVSGVWELSREKVAKNASHCSKNNNKIIKKIMGYFDI